MYYVYALSSINKKYIYVGLTSNVILRFHRHNNGYEKTTKPYSPFTLIFSIEVSSDRQEARKVEKYYKNLRQCFNYRHENLTKLKSER